MIEGTSKWQSIPEVGGAGGEGVIGGDRVAQLLAFPASHSQSGLLLRLLLHNFSMQDIPKT